MKIIPQAFAHNFGSVGTTIYCTHQGKLYRAIAANEVNTQQVSIVIGDDGVARCMGHSPPQRIEAYTRVDRFRHAKPVEESQVEPNYWFVYQIEYRVGVCAVATEIWLGGSENKLLKRYERGEPYTASFDYWRNNSSVSGSTIKPISEFDYAAEFPGADIQDLTLSGGTTPALTASNAGAGNGAPGFGTGIFRLYPEIPDNNHSYRVSGSVSYSLSTSGGVGTNSSFFLLDEFALQSGAGSDSGTFNYNQCDTITIELRLNGAVTNESAGPSSMSASATTTALQIALEPRPELLYLATEDESTYAAVLYSQSPGVMAVDYFVNGELSATFTEDTPSTAADWRSSLIGLDRDYSPPATGDACVDEYRSNSYANLYQGTLKTVDSEALDQVLATNATIEITVRQTLSGETCTLGDSASEFRSAVAVKPASPQPGQIAETTILWAAP